MSLRRVEETAFARFSAALGDAEAAARCLNRGELPDAFAGVERVRAILERTQLEAALRAAGERRQEDRVLSVKEAAGRLGCSTSYLYREADRLPFTIRIGGKLGFSESGIGDFVRRGGKA